MNLEPLKLESPYTSKTVETRQTLTLAELGHDADRDRPTHLFLAGYDDTVPQRAHCDTLVKPPFRPRHGTRGRTCASSASQSPRGCVTTRVTTTMSGGSKAGDPNQPNDGGTQPAAAHQEFA